MTLNSNSELIDAIWTIYKAEEYWELPLVNHNYPNLPTGSSVHHLKLADKDICINHDLKPESCTSGNKNLDWIQVPIKMTTNIYVLATPSMEKAIGLQCGTGCDPDWDGPKKYELVPLAPKDYMTHHGIGVPGLPAIGAHPVEFTTTDYDFKYSSPGYNRVVFEIKYSDGAVKKIYAVKNPNGILGLPTSRGPISLVTNSRNDLADFTLNIAADTDNNRSPTSITIKDGRTGRILSRQKIQKFAMLPPIKIGGEYGYPSVESDNNIESVITSYLEQHSLNRPTAQVTDEDELISQFKSLYDGTNPSFEYGTTNEVSKVKVKVTKPELLKKYSSAVLYRLVVVPPETVTSYFALGRPYSCWLGEDNIHMDSKGVLSLDLKGTPCSKLKSGDKVTLTARLTVYTHIDTTNIIGGGFVSNQYTVPERPIDNHSPVTPPVLVIGPTVTHTEEATSATNDVVTDGISAPVNTAPQVIEVVTNPRLLGNSWGNTAIPINKTLLAGLTYPIQVQIVDNNYAGTIKGTECSLKKESTSSTACTIRMYYSKDTYPTISGKIIKLQIKDAKRAIIYKEITIK